MGEFRPGLLDERPSGYARPSDLLGEESILRELKKRPLEHPSCQEGLRPVDRSANNRNGHKAKTVLIDEKVVALPVPRDRDDTLELSIVPKGADPSGRLRCPDYQPLRPRPLGRRSANHRRRMD
jgi:hypothetical protein